jgi:hypothetical protein
MKKPSMATAYRLLRPPAVGDNVAMQVESPHAEPPKRKRRWFQFSLRTLLIGVTLLAAACSWFGGKMERARRQRAAVDCIGKHGGSVVYDYQLDELGNVRSDAAPPQPSWLRSLSGDDIFTSVVDVTFDQSTTDAGLPHLTGFDQLLELCLDDANITDAGMENLKALEYLRVLRLCGTKITNAGLESLKGLTQLERLTLSGTKITDSGLKSLSGMQQLHQLELERTLVTDAGLEYLKGLASLQSLDLWDTQVTDAGLMKLSRLTNLQSLYLGGTRVTNIGLEHLMRLKRLQDLDLRGTHVTDEGVAKLQQVLPACTIVQGRAPL